jgi:hypothetical protein
MGNTKLENPKEQTFRLSVGDPRSCQASIVKVADGYTVMVALEETSHIRMLSESSVDSYADAEAVVKAYTSQQEFPWYKVAVASR